MQRQREQSGRASAHPRPAKRLAVVGIKSAASTVKTIAGAMELYWLAVSALGVRLWNFFGAGKNVGTAAARGHRLPVERCWVSLIVYTGTRMN